MFTRNFSEMSPSTGRVVWYRIILSFVFYVSCSSLPRNWSIDVNVIIEEKWSISIARHTHTNNSVKPHSHANPTRKWITLLPFTLWAAGIGWLLACLLVWYHINHHWHVPPFIILACMLRARVSRNNRTHSTIKFIMIQMNNNNV